MNYYRIKSVDADGKTTYSSIAAITWESTTATVAITLAPQPLESVMTVSITGNIGDAQFTVYDISGKPLHNVQFNGNKQFTINKGKMAAGIYVYKLTNRAGKILANGKLMVR